MEINYIETREEDFEKLSILFKEIFRKETTKDYFKWKYKNGYSVIALLKDEIVGHYGGIFFDFIYKNKKFKIVQATDLMTHPKVRHLFGKKSVILNLANLFFDYCSKEKIDFAYGFPGEKSRLLGEKFLNYIPLSRVYFYMFELENENIIFPVEKFEFINYEIKEIVNRNKKEGIKKDLNYLQWRYIENPEESYYISYNEDSLFIFKIAENKAILMDSFYIDEKKAKKLFKGIQTSLKNFGIDYLKTFSLGFIQDEKFQIKEENYFLEFKPINKNPKDFLKFKHFSPSDYDVF